MPTLLINIYDIYIKITTDCEFVSQNLTKDFTLFHIADNSSKNNPHITISISKQLPAFNRVPPLEAALHGPGLICYKEKNINYVVYSCNGLLIYDFVKDNGELFGTDEIFLYEKAKLTILSRVGELLDQRGLHRIHAFGVSLNNQSLICLLPMEAGKTTSIINLLRANQNIKIIADDMCFIDKQGHIYPFLLRIGVRDKELIKNTPPSFITEINRPYYGIKYFIDPDFFQTRISMPTRLTHILIGKRIFQQETKIENISKLKCLGPVIESGVFGMGLPQLLEFFIRGDFKLFSQRIGIILSRLFFCFRILSRTKTFVIKIGLDKNSSVEEILKFLKKSKTSY